VDHADPDAVQLGVRHLGKPSSELAVAVVALDLDLPCRLRL
jgi:hypothetical protein